MITERSLFDLVYGQKIILLKTEEQGSGALNVSEEEEEE
jgi:hypothetical protein